METISPPVMPPAYQQPQKKKSGCLWALTAFAVVGFGGCALILGLAAGGASKHRGAEGTSSEAGSTSSQETFKVGDTVTFDDSQWQVLEAKSLGNTLRGGPFSETKKTAGRFVYVRFKLINITKEEERIMDTPKVRDSQGRVFRQFDETSLFLPEGENTLTLEQLTAGISKTFTEIYEVAADSSDLSFMTRELGFGGDEKAVKLGF